ncbi:MAG: hypothetical protein M0R23_08195 [Bacteroidales bacterium]|nr:hypothetical protein [Bacteroidales bacterium]
MNVKQTKVDDLNLIVSIKIENADYAQAKSKKLNEFRKQAEIKGFRKGTAPISLIEKIHGHSALADTINTIVTDQINNFIEKNKLNVIGEPLPNENEAKNDWDKEGDFTFDFDIALAPKVEFTLSAEDKVPYYDVTVTAKAQNDYKSSLLKQFGTLENAEESKEDDILIVDFVQGETTVEKAYVSLKSIEDEIVKKSFIGKKIGDVMKVDVNKTFTNETDRAALLKVKKEQLSSMDPMWDMTVMEVKTFVDAKPTQAVFDNIFGEGSVKSEAEFDAKVKERLKYEYEQESDYRFMIDAREYLMNKTDLKLPEAFIKRWLYVANEGKFTMEDIEKEFGLFLKDFRWQMIRTYIMKEQNIQVTKEDLLKQAKAIAEYQFAMYGMNNVPEEHLTKFTENILADEQQSRKIYEKVEDDMTLSYIRKSVTLEKKKISLEKMRELTK